MLTVSNALLMSSATVIVRSGGLEKLAGGPQTGTSDSPPLARVMGVGRQQQQRFRTKHLTELAAVKLIDYI